MMRKPKHLGIRFACLLLCCVLALVPFTAPAVSAVESAPEVQPVYRQASNVHLYASASSTVIGMIENGTMLNVLGKSGSYYKISLDGMNGYIAKSQVYTDEYGYYYVNCAWDSADTVALNIMDSEAVAELQRSLIKLAIKQLGTKYVWGGSKPGGFDCSGLTSYLYATVGYAVNRSALTQMSEGIVIAEEDLQPGDLLFYKDTGRWGGIASHVAIYVGDGKMIHADSYGVRVTDLSDTYYATRYIGARRVLLPDSVQTEIESETEENWWESPVNSTGALFYVKSPKFEINNYCTMLEKSL